MPNELKPVAETPAQSLATMNADPLRFLDHHSPMKSALWLALLRPAADVMADVAETLRAEPTPEGSDDPTEDRPPPNSKPAIIALGEMVVAKALRGDTVAMNMIAERIEGKIGNRKGDIDPEAETRNETVRAAIEGVVKALTSAKHNAVEIEGKMVDVTDVGAETPAHGANGHDTAAS